MRYLARGTGQQNSVCFVTRSQSLLQLLGGEELAVTGGAEVQMSQIALYLAAKGWDVSFTVYDMGQDDEVIGRGNIRLIRGYRHDGGVPGLRRLTHKLPRLWRALVRADADVYVIRGASWVAGLVAFFARRKGRRSVVWMAHDRDPVWGLPRHTDVNGQRISFLDAALYRYALAHCDLIVAQTYAQRELLREARNLEAVVVPNMVSCEGEIGSRGSVNRVLWVGNFRPFKRPEMLLEVAEKLPHIQFVMIGGPKIGHERLYEDCQRRAAGIPNLEFLGPLPFAETDRYFSEASVVLLTSESEGFPNVLLQAWAHGTPTVSTFDPDGLIQEHGLGYHCHTVEEMATRIQQLVSDPVLRDEIGKRAREYVAAHHSPEVIMPRVEELLLGLLAQSARTTRARGHSLGT